MSDSENVSEIKIAAAKKAFVRTIADALFKAERHIRGRHIMKSDVWLRRRAEDIAVSRNELSERMASTFDNDFFDVILAILRAVLSDNVLEEAAEYCASHSNSHMSYALEFDMPQDICGHGFVVDESGNINRVECERIRLVFRKTAQFCRAIESDDINIPDGCTCCIVVTCYPIREA